MRKIVLLTIKLSNSINLILLNPLFFSLSLKTLVRERKIWFICWIVHEKVLVHLFKSSQWKIFVRLFKSSRNFSQQLFKCSKVLDSKWTTVHLFICSLNWKKSLFIVQKFNCSWTNELFANFWTVHAQPWT